jgi:hypothetical protein
VTCVSPKTLYLPDKAGDQSSNICEVLSAAIRGIESGRGVLVVFEFKLKNIYEAALLVF